MINKDISNENEDIIHQWEPLKFNITEKYKYVPDSIIYKFFSGFIYYVIAYPILWILTKIIYDLKIEGKENLKKLESGAITVSNHVLVLDCVMVGLACIRKKLYFTTREGSFKIPFVRKLIRLLRAIPIPKDLKNKEFFAKTVDKLLKRNKLVHFYPEAALWPYNETLRNFKSGAFVFAVKSEVPILPIVITFRNPKGIRRIFKRKKDVTIKILEPVYSIEDDNMTQKEIINDLKCRVYDVMNNYFK